MKRILKTDSGWTIERYINKDKIASERWGKVWFKFKLGDVINGGACSSCLHGYLPKNVMSEVVKNWAEDFKGAK